MPAFRKRYLIAAGPTPIPPEVEAAMAAPMIHHREPEFLAIFAECLERLRALIGTRSIPLLLAASGTGAMEMAVAGLVRPGERVLVASCGRFGEEWLVLARAHGAEVEFVDFGWGATIEVDRLAEACDAHPDIEVLFVTHVETSTGVTNDLEALGAFARERGLLLVADAVSALGAVPVRQDDWGVDVICGGSQKALMVPAGVGILSASERAAERMRATPNLRYYLDFALHHDAALEEVPGTAFTPPVSLVRGLHAALRLIEQEGFEEVYERHRALGRAARAGAGALGLGLLAEPRDANGVATAITLPDDLDAGRFFRLLRERYMLSLAGGQGAFRGRLVRLGHCGYVGGFDVIIALAGIEMALRGCDRPVQLGAGVAAAEEVLWSAGVEV